MTLPKRILVPVDLSDASRAALEFAGKLAETFDASIDVVHVDEAIDYMPSGVTIEVPGRGRVPLIEMAREQAETELSAFLEGLAGVKVTNRYLLTGKASRAIVEIARSSHYDLIVMGKHGRKSLDRLFLGSVTERVLRQSPCPVLAVPETAPAPAHETRRFERLPLGGAPT